MKFLVRRGTAILSFVTVHALKMSVYKQLKSLKCVA